MANLIRAIMNSETMYLTFLAVAMLLYPLVLMR